MKNKLIVLIVVFCITSFLSFYRLDYYVMRPGSAYDVSDFLKVQDGDQDDEGSFHLMTVSMGQATPITYGLAMISEYEEILQLEDVRQDEEDDEEYNLRQLKLMSDSQFNATYVAFEKAKKPYSVVYKGVYVLNVLSNSAADGVLVAGDEVISLNGKRIERQGELVQLLENKQAGDEVTIQFKHKNSTEEKTIVLKEIPGADGRVGLGISFAENKSIRTEPKVEVETEKIGGPSAGMMFTLELLNQLKEEDITKGYKVAGTGEMNEDGSVGRIGGIEKKVVAAHKAKMEIFFAPDDEITETMKASNANIVSNYEAAVATAKEIDTTMKIVPVKTIDDALNYLANLQPKN